MCAKNGIRPPRGPLPSFSKMNNGVPLRSCFIERMFYISLSVVVESICLEPKLIASATRKS